MNVLLDHCVPQSLGRWLVGHRVRVARAEGWDGLSNGKLLAEASESFDVLITVDRKLMHEQNIGTLPMPVIVLLSLDNTVDSLTPLVAEVLSLLSQRLSRRIYVVPQSSTRGRG